MTGLAASAIEAHQVAAGVGHAPSTRCCLGTVWVSCPVEAGFPVSTPCPCPSR
jgi:hypothetical protein